MADAIISGFLGLKYLGKEISFLAEIFRAFYSQTDLSVGEIPGRIIVIRFVGIGI
jgi:hypothetical protein